MYLLDLEIIQEIIATLLLEILNEINKILRSMLANSKYLLHVSCYSYCYYYP